MGKDDTVEIKLSVLQGLDKVAATNPLIMKIVEGQAPDKSTFIYASAIHLEAKASEQRPGYAIVYENEKCHLTLPPTRSAEIEFTAGRVSSVDMFVPLEMLTLQDAIETARSVGDAFARAGCLQTSGAEKDITETSLADKVGEKSAIISAWKMCGPADVSGLITVRYYGSQYVGTSVPLGAIENPFHDRREHFLVELNISVDLARYDELQKQGYRLNEKVTGKRFDPPPLKEWLRHPDWYGRGP